MTLLFPLSFPVLFPSQGELGFGYQAAARYCESLAFNDLLCLGQSPLLSSFHIPCAVKTLSPPQWWRWRESNPRPTHFQLPVFARQFGRSPPQVRPNPQGDTGISGFRGREQNSVFIPSLPLWLHIVAIPAGLLFLPANSALQVEGLIRRSLLGLSRLLLICFSHAGLLRVWLLNETESYPCQRAGAIPSAATRFALAHFRQ